MNRGGRKYEALGKNCSRTAAMEVSCAGDVDIFLYRQPTGSHWRRRYFRHTKFSLDTDSQRFDSTAFGQKSRLKFDKGPHLLHKIMLCMQVPAIYAEATDIPQSRHRNKIQSPYPAYRNESGSTTPPCQQWDRQAFAKSAQTYENMDPNDPRAVDVGRDSWARRNYGCAFVPSDDSATGCCGADTLQELLDSGVPFAHWTNALAMAAVRRVTFGSGKFPIDSFSGLGMFVWDEFTGKPGKELREMVGKFDTPEALIRAAKFDQTLLLPIPYTCTVSAGNAFALNAVDDDVWLEVEWESLPNLIITSDKNVRVCRGDNGETLRDTDLNAWVDTVTAFLDRPERNAFARGNFDQLIVQHHEEIQPATIDHVKIPVTVKNPIIEAFVAVRRKSQEAQNNWFNFSGIKGMEPVRSIQLTVDDKPRMAGRPAEWWRVAWPYFTHTRMPTRHLYNPGWSLNPEDMQPSGSFNPKCGNVVLHILLQEGLAEADGVNVYVMYRTHTTLRYRDGAAYVLY